MKVVGDLPERKHFQGRDRSMMEDGWGVNIENSFDNLFGRAEE